MNQSDLCSETVDYGGHVKCCRGCSEEQSDGVRERGEGLDLREYLGVVLNRLSLDEELEHVLLVNGSQQLHVQAALGSLRSGACDRTTDSNSSSVPSATVNWTTSGQRESDESCAVAVDGKTLRGSRTVTRRAMHLVAAVTHGERAACT
ncbi:hypothetical protein [Streptomyces sp. GESEQ-35]|uniref:hypothetical protein n=1 Tax=Streptomyces sp. GESEQ-35 TaxID=2812657 RepID=UPI001B32603C|nr:hypothetical protein [Streptomyces sp. GESEQ-35]